ncbi:MAG: hypothetical protein IJS76_02710 [Pseudobutyrivibrio sp.]|nr:hypothetical protein [Pseudobutyrivibrio sp.]
MEKRKIKYIAIVVLLVAFCLRNQILKCIVGLTLDNYTSSRYSVGCTVDSIKSEGWNNKLIYAHDEKGVNFLAKSNMFGIITEESYAHFYYTTEGNDEIDKIVGGIYQGEFKVVKNLFCFQELDHYLLNVNDTKTYENYVDVMREKEHYYLVYIKEKPSKKDLKLILEALEKASLDDNISVLINYAPEEVYNLQEGLSAYLGYTESDFSKYCDSTEDMHAFKYYIDMPFKVAVYNYAGTEILDGWE